METLDELEREVWWDYLGEDLQKLIKTSELIFTAVKGWGADLPGGKKVFDDYSFVIFPAAKAYEGYLKKLFLDLKFIDEEDYYGKHFRIGKALNPSLPKKMMKEGVYNKIVKITKSHQLADLLWETWKECRNLTFHWFPNEKNAISLSESGQKIEMVLTAIRESFNVFELGKK